MPLPNWQGSTVFCIASGPSLTADDCAAVQRSGLPTVVTNTTFRACTWADALYAFDGQWLRRYIAEIRETFRGRVFCQSVHIRMRGVECARAYQRFRSFGNSGACAVSLAVCAGAARVVLLGYDASFAADGRSHHHGDHPPGLRNCDTMPRWSVQFERLAAYATRAAVIVNASRATALTCFPRVTLEAELNAWPTRS